MSDWHIRKKSEGCVRCEREFAEGEAHFSVLTVREAQLERLDACRTCFQEDPPEDSLYWWRTRRVEGKKRIAVDFEAVEGLFLALADREDPKLQELRYLLSLLLMRKRRLKLLRMRRDPDGEVMLVRRPRRQDEIEVKVFDLTPERAGELHGDLAQIFEGDLEELATGGGAEVGEEGDPSGPTDPGSESEAQGASL